jgi:hypothetical protein
MGIDIAGAFLVVYRSASKLGRDDYELALAG